MCLLKVAVEFELKSQSVHLIVGLCLIVLCLFSASADLEVKSQMSYLRSGQGLIVSRIGEGD